MDGNRKELLEASMGKLFIKMAIPAVVGMMAVGLYNLVDAIFVGQLVSSEGVGAIALAYNITLLNMAVAMLFAMGAMSVLSRAMGEKDQETIGKLFGNVLIGVCIGSGIISLLVYNFANPMLQFIGAEDEILSLATRYLKVISLGFIFAGLGPALNFLIRGEGQMKKAMQIIIFGTLLNIALDPVFIKFFGMGIEGAGLATIVSQFAVLLGDIIYFASGKSIIKISTNSFKMSRDILPNIFGVGISGFAMQIMPAIQMSIMFKVMSVYGGNKSVIVMSASYRVMMFAFITLWGIAQGVQPIIGANYGAGMFERVKEAFMVFGRISTYVAASLWLCFMLFAESILGWFIREDSLVQQGIADFRIFNGIFLLYGFMAMCMVFFQAIGKGKQAAIIIIGRQILFFIPIVLLLPMVMGEPGAWLAMPVGDLLTIIMGAVFVVKELGLLKRKSKALAVANGAY